MLQVLPKKLKRDAALQGYLADMNKEEFLELITRVYDAEMRDEREEVRYEPTVCQVQQVSLEGRLKKLEEKEDLRDKKMDQMMGMLREMSTGMPKPQGGRQFNEGRQYRSDAGAGKVTCYKCLREGHYARNCPNGITCTKCREEGHVRAQCPKN